MYLGKSKKTLLRHDKARKALASQGFHDVFTFMALKERAASSRRGGLEDVENGSERERAGHSPIGFDPGDFGSSGRMLDTAINTGCVGDTPGGGGGLEDVENKSEREHIGHSPIGFDPGNFGSSGRILDINSNTGAVGDSPGGGGGLEDLKNKDERE